MGLLLEGGWRPAVEDEPPPERLIAAIERILPSMRILLWNVRGDMPAVEFAGIMIERMRTIGRAGMWRDVVELETLLDEAKAARTQC